MRRHVEFLVLAVCVAVFGACASSNMAERNTKVYPVDMNTVVEAATAVFVENNLDIEDQAWTSDDSFVLTGYVRSALARSTLVRSGDSAVSVGAIEVYIDRVSETEAKVRVVTSARQTHAMASSADRREDEEVQWFFSRLDAKLG